MKVRDATRRELIRYHEEMVKGYEAKIRAAARALARAKDSKRSHQRALERLTEG